MVPLKRMFIKDKQNMGKLAQLSSLQYGNLYNFYYQKQFIISSPK